jgi:hypothetical protein
MYSSPLGVFHADERTDRHGEANKHITHILLQNILILHGDFMQWFQVLEAARVKTAAVWNIAPCSIVEVDRCFRDAYCLHYQGDDNHPDDDDDDDDDDYYYYFKCIYICFLNFQLRGALK